MEQLAERMGEYAVVLLAGMLALMGSVAILLWRWIETSGQALREKMDLLLRAVVALPLPIRLRRRFPRLWLFLARRLSPEGYLGLYLTIGLTLLLAVLLLFLELAEGIGGGEEIARFDQALAGALHRHASPAVLRFFVAVTQLGNFRVIVALGLALGLILIFCREWLLFASWAVALAGGGLLNVELKALFRRVRPGLPNPFMTERGWSFPSGHAMGALIAYGMLAYLLLIVFHGKGRRWIVLSAALIIWLIGVSRMYLGVHYFSDVMAGYVAGTAWLAICITGTEVARRRRSPARRPG